MASSALRDRRILVVEDEYLIAMSLVDALENVGSIVVGPVPSVDTAIKKIELDPYIDAAVVDVNLGGEVAYAVADMLIARKIPFVFTSGYEYDALRNRYPQIKSCPNPICSERWRKRWPKPCPMMTRAFKSQASNTARHRRPLGRSPRLPERSAGA